MPTIDQLITSGGALAILAGCVLAFYTGRVVTKASADETLKMIIDVWRERLAEERADKEAWKAQAQQLTPAVAKMADELEEVNSRDEEWVRLLAASGDRRRGESP